MTTRRSTLRGRLLVALVGVSAGSVLAAGLITVVFARQAARSGATAELADTLASIAEAEAAGQVLPNLTRLQRILRLQGMGTVLLGPRGRLAGTNLGGLPAGIDAADLDLAALAAGRVDSGHKGLLVFVAQPLARKSAGLPILVATRRVAPLGRLGGVLLVASLAAAVAAALLSVFLARRLTRPLSAMEDTARRIAAGDLSARVEGLAGADDELAALGSALDAMAAGLEGARQMERGFLMSVSHDLRTPLTSIRGYAEAIAEGAVDDDEGRRRAADIIGAEARRLERLVADLLDLARLDAREFTLRPVLCDAAEVVVDAAEALAPAARDAGLALVTRAPDGRVELPVDPERLGQIVANLVENALKYATTTVTVEVRRARAGPGGGGLAVAVTDDGPGLDPADLPHVFDRLYTSRRQPGRKVGTGLGLAIVRELAAAMGGTVEAGRTPEGGTLFVVTVAGRPPGSRTSTSAGTSWSSPSA